MKVGWSNMDSLIRIYNWEFSFDLFNWRESLVSGKVLLDFPRDSPLTLPCFPVRDPVFQTPCTVPVENSPKGDSIPSELRN